MDKVYNCVVTKYNCQIILTYLNAFKKLKPTLGGIQKPRGQKGGEGGQPKGHERPRGREGVHQKATWPK